MTPLQILSAHGDHHLVSMFVRRMVVDPVSGCWIWTGSTNDHGYGRFNYGENGRLKAEGAHRFAYRSAFGVLPKVLDHIVCERRNCANPFHVVPSTTRSNNLRSKCPSGLNAKKTRCRYGHPYDDGNTLLTVNPRNKSLSFRQCRTCNRLRMRRVRAARSTV